MPFVSVVPIIVPLCSIYLWCNQNGFKRILQWISTIYSGANGAIATNCSLTIFAKSLDGLPRAWVRIPPTPPTMAIGSQRNLRAFLFLNFASCEMLQRFIPHRVCHPNPLRQLWQSALREIWELFCCLNLFLISLYAVYMFCLACPFWKHSDCSSSVCLNGVRWWENNCCIQDWRSGGIRPDWAAADTNQDKLPA